MAADCLRGGVAMLVTGTGPELAGWSLPMLVEPGAADRAVAAVTEAACADHLMCEKMSESPESRGAAIISGLRAQLVDREISPGPVRR